MGKGKTPAKTKTRQTLGALDPQTRPGALTIGGPLATLLGGPLGRAGSILRPNSPSAR